MKIIITGYSGKVGKELLKLCLSPEYINKLNLVAGIAKNAESEMDKELDTLLSQFKPAILHSDNLAHNIEAADLVIDFSLPEAAIHFAEICEVHNKAFVSGTTGFSDAHLKKLGQIAKKIPVFWSPNMSVAVNLTARIVELAAQTLDESLYDIEVVEMHHNKKIDSPSGTAIMLAEAAAKGRGTDLRQHAVYAREGDIGARKKGDIGFATVRGGDIPGDHTVIFAGAGERIEITHRATNRSIFARGALNAAFWLEKQKPGKVYNVYDMLSI